MNALTPRTVIVSIMAVNNETGAAYDIKSAFDAAHKLSPDIVTHTDAVQAYSHIPFSRQTRRGSCHNFRTQNSRASKGTGDSGLSCSRPKNCTDSPRRRSGKRIEVRNRNVPGIAGWSRGGRDNARPDFKGSGALFGTEGISRAVSPMKQS